MKKLYILLLISIVVSFSGCANESHASENTVIDDFFTAYKAQDYSTAKTFIATGSKDSFDSLQTLIADDSLNSILLNHMSKLTYKVLSSDLQENSATLKVRIIYPNAGGAFMNAIGTMYVDASEGKLSNDAPDQVTTYISGLLKKHLDTELETMDRERDVELVKEDGEWRIVMTEEFKNALSANMMNAIEELEIMGVQF